MKLFNVLYPPVPWIEWTKSNGIVWEAKANWGYSCTNRFGYTRMQARHRSLRAVFFYRLFAPFRTHWISQDEYEWPRWYDWLVG